MKLAIRTTQTLTKISQTLEEVTHHHEAYDDLMFMLRITPVKIYGGRIDQKRQPWNKVRCCSRKALRRLKLICGGVQ